MKGTIYIVCLIALISAMMVITPAAAKTWYVDDDGGYDFTTIQDALNVASDGDIIFVYNGTYGAVEIFSLNAPNLTVIGEGADVVTYSRLGSEIRIGDQQPSPGCIVEGFTILNSPTGLKVYSGSPNCIIRNCVFEGMTASGSILINADNTTFENNVVSNQTGSYYAIGIKEADSCTVANNIIINNSNAGICLYKSATINAIITKNNISSNPKGIWVYRAGDGNKIYLNDIIDYDVSVYYTTPPATIFWNSTEQIEYAYGGSTYTSYLGNYWSDYTGSDADGDGIGDTDYDTLSTDPNPVYNDTRPLMAGYENYPAPVPAQPDLTPTAITLPELLLLNKSSTINASIANIGTDDAGSFNVSLSADGTVIDTISVESVGVGNTTNVSFEWTPASAGDYELCVVADSDNSIDELSEANNEICTGVTVLAPDLVPTAITTPTLFVDQPGTITATIENTGTDDAGSFNVSLSAGGTPVDTATVDSLNAGKSTNVSFEWTPASAGDIELCVLADCDDSVNEQDETNNEMCIEVEIKPDLITTEVTTAELLLLNQSSVVNASIANVGNADAGSFNVSLSANGTVVDTANVASLGIGNDTNVSFQWTPALAGEVDLCVVADSDNSIDELNETNNDKCVVVTVHAPDLVPTAMTPDAFFPGKPNTITATIENMGDADAGSFNVALSVDGAVVDTASVASLGDGASTEVSFSWTATVGDHELCVLADSDSEVDESDEANNELCKDVTVYPNTVYLVPKDSGAPYCCEAEVEVWVEAADGFGFQGGQINLAYSLDCANVTGVKFNPVWDFDNATWWDTYGGYTRISFAKSEGTVSGDIRIGNLMIHCTSEDIDTLCSTTLSCATTTKLVNDFGTEIEANLIEGTFGCEIPAKVLKGDAISDLDAINATNKHSQKEIDKAIKHIGRSLEDSLWNGAARLDSKHGNKVFDEEKKAVKHLKKITEEKGKHADTEIVSDVEAVIAKLTEEADEQLATVAINDAKSTLVQDAKKQDKVDKEIAKAEKELDKARQELAKDKPDKAIDHFKKAWEHAQHAMKHAQK